MKNIPLLYYPTTHIWVDDDLNFLNNMVFSFEDENKILPFQSAETCLEFLKTHHSLIEQQTFLKCITEHANYGILQRAPIDFDIASISELSDNPDRFHEVSVMVIDYNMPEMDGFALAEAINLPIQKILLTGKAHESEAIIGFNRNLIDKFVQKGDPDLTHKLENYLKELSFHYFERLTFPLLSHLETDAKLPLTDQIFIKFFEEYCDKHHIKEFYLLDKQGSFLCIDDEGMRQVLAVQSDKGMDSWISYYGNSLNIKELDYLKNRQKIPFYGPGKEAWHFEESEWPKHFYETNIIHGSREDYYWATVSLI